MKRAFSTVIAFLLCCSLAFAASPEQRETPLDNWKDSLRERFSKCVSSFGLLTKLPVATGGQPSEIPLAIISTSTPGLVNDGYYYDLYVYGHANVAYLVEFGSIAGGQVAYGPISLGGACPTQQSTGASANCAGCRPVI